MAEKLSKACQGKDATDGGLSRTELQKLATTLNPTLSKHVIRMSRAKLLDLVCHRMCPSIRYVGADNIISDIDVDIVKKQFTYKGLPVVTSMEKIAEGGYGVVHKHTFKSAGKTLYFATKKAKEGKKLEEAIVIQNYTEALECPGIISMKVRETPDGASFVIMPLADGDLHTFRGIATPQQAEHIVQVVAKALLCMYRQGICYFDIKPANILFNCDGHGISYIYLGDMGSVIPHSGEYTATYPPPIAKSGWIGTSQKKDALKIYTYQLSCLYCQLVSGASPPVWNRPLVYQYYEDLRRLIDATRDKLGLPADGSGDSNRYISVLATELKIMDFDKLPELDVFLKYEAYV